MFSARATSVFAVGVYGNEGPPVPIPNTVVKLICADNTWLEAAREDRTTPTQKELRETSAQDIPP